MKFTAKRRGSNDLDQEMSEYEREGYERLQRTTFCWPEATLDKGKDCA